MSVLIDQSGYTLTVLTLHSSSHQDMFVFNVPWANGGTIQNHLLYQLSLNFTPTLLLFLEVLCVVCVCVCVYRRSLYPVKSTPPLCVAMTALCGSVVAAVVRFWSKWCHGLNISPKANYVSIHSTAISFLCVKEDASFLLWLLYKIYYLACMRPACVNVIV